MKFDIEKLRSLSGPQKANLAFVVASVCAGFVGVVWFTTLGARFADGPIGEEIVKDEVPKIVQGEETEGGQAWEEFMGNVGTQVGSIIEGFKSIKIETGAEDRNVRTVAPTEESDQEEYVPVPAGEVVHEAKIEGEMEVILVGTGAVKSAE